MSAEFADSNILIYAASEVEWKAHSAQQIIARSPVVSVQVLNETASVLVNKLNRPWSETVRFLASIRSHSEVVPLDEQTHETGVQLAIRYKLHIYDGTIVAAALLAGCETLYSEDMHPGLVIENRMRIINPFAVG
jgi:predicted nucleic acid-binding protein